MLICDISWHLGFISDISWNLEFIRNHVGWPNITYINILYRELLYSYHCRYVKYVDSTIGMLT